MNRFTQYLLCLLAGLCLFAAALTTSAEAAEVASGPCGTNLIWSLDEDGLLTISGEGKMNEFFDYAYRGERPWAGHEAAVTALCIESGVTTICTSAFSGHTNLQRVELPNGLTQIGDSAFESCTSLTSIRVPDSVNTIGGSTFYKCSKLETVTLPDEMDSIGPYVFAYCSSLTQITLPRGITSVGYLSFFHCYDLLCVTIQEGPTKIGSETFRFCDDLCAVYLPKSLESIDDYAFDRCDDLRYVFYGGTRSDWKEISIGKENSLPYAITADSPRESYSSYAKHIETLNHAGAITLHGPQEVVQTCNYSGNHSLTGVKTAFIEADAVIGYWAFKELSTLEQAVIEDGATQIGTGAFQDCSRLTSLYIPASVTDFDSGCLSGCPNLTVWTYRGAPAAEYAAAQNIPVRYLDDCEPKSLTVTSNLPETLEAGSAALDHLTVSVLLSDEEAGILMPVSDFELDCDPHRPGHQTVTVPGTV